MNRIRAKQEINYRGAFPSLRQIADEVQIAPSTFTRLAKHKDLSGAALLRILVWLNRHGDAWPDLMRVVTANPNGKRKTA